MTSSMKACVVSVLGLIVLRCSPAFVQPSVGPSQNNRVLRGTADTSQNPGFRAETTDSCAGASWSTLSQAVAVGAVFGLVMALGSSPALASNEASGYREKDQSIIAYNGNKAVGGKSKGQQDAQYNVDNTQGGLLGKLGSFTTSVAPEAQITLDELATIDPSAKPTKK